MSATNLISAAHAAAARVETAAADMGATFSAEQGWYGVEFEALVSGEWVRGIDLDPQQEADAEAVRLFDCDGERGRTCRTVEEVNAGAARWIAALETAEISESAE